MPSDSDNDARVIRKLSTSPFMLVVADSILENVDRQSLAELLASYLYFKSKGASIGDLLSYAVSTRFRQFASILAEATPALLAGMLTDDDFRSVMLSSAESLIRGRQSRLPARKNQ